MKKLLVLIVILSFAICLVPAFAAEKADSASKTTSDRPSSFFQQASDDISGLNMNISDKSATEIFQESRNSIVAGSPEAKEGTLRGHKSELKRRRMGKNIILI